MDLLQPALNGDRRALARIITLVENNTTEGREILGAIYRLAGKAQVIGITGAPGAGKSTLVDQIAKAYRATGKTVGIVAVDPSSAMTGGAVLGDRVRMQDLAGDPGIFIRSMATRGSLGGLARATRDVITVLDAAGKDIVLVETVGVGQDEVAIAEAAHTTLVVGVPGLGDDIQAIKAGVLEIADIYVVNKADKDGADRLVSELQMLLSLAGDSAWRAPIVKTIATSGEGVDELLQAIAIHQRYLQDSGKILDDRQHQAREELLASIRIELTTRLLQDQARKGKFEELVRALAERRIDPFTATKIILDGQSGGSGFLPARE